MFKLKLKLTECKLNYFILFVSLSLVTDCEHLDGPSIVFIKELLNCSFLCELCKLDP